MTMLQDCSYVEVCLALQSHLGGPAVAQAFSLILLLLTFANVQIPAPHVVFEEKSQTPPRHCWGVAVVAFSQRLCRAFLFYFCRTNAPPSGSDRSVSVASPPSWRWPPPSLLVHAWKSEEEMLGFCGSFGSRSVFSGVRSDLRSVRSMQIGAPAGVYL